MLLRSSRLHYPITITRIYTLAGADVEKGAQLFTYSYKSQVEEGDKYGDKKTVDRDYYEDFHAPIDGKITGWKVRIGEEIDRDGVHLVEIEEPCLHEVQFGGMCANCGKDMTEVDFGTGQKLTDRANVNLSHSHIELKVSHREASRINEESRRRLLATRKLSLVVDLDQTIIHATVDPTVAEWQKDTENPNHGAVKDVRAFQLVDEGPGGRGCWYYIKLRPGLLKFLEDISKLYELHIYTMGTRAYAQNIAKIVDPDRKIFADRILSRDENGNMNAKSLHRLFPVDTKMVVIIDDRGDVWQWSANLIKVVQYDFFVGIGDINSSFLPKVEKLQREAKAIQAKKDAETATVQPEASMEAAPSEDANSSTQKEAEAAADDGEDISALEQQLVAMAGGDNPRLLEEQTSQADQTINAQREDRPLLKKQEMLDKVDEELSRTQTNGTESSEEEIAEQQKPRHNLLHDDDVELEHLERNLSNVHQAFFEEYEKKLMGSTGGRIAELRGEKGAKRRLSDDLFAVPDIKEIMPRIKEDVLRGLVIVFSGVVPLNIDVQISDIALWAKTFGARVQIDINSATTHVVATRQRKTHKVKIAARRPKIKIVTIDWLIEAFSTWQKPDEEPYKIEVEPEENGTHDGALLGVLGDDENGQILSGEDDITGDELETGATNTDFEGDMPGELVTNFEDQSQENNFDESVSPTDKIDWGDVDEELKEFLGSDSEGDQSDDSHASDASSASKTGRKRKRGDSSAENSDQEASADDNASLNGQGSRLQRRKKQAMARVSSLTNMTAADGKDGGGLPSPDTTGPEEAQKNGGEGMADEEDADDDWGSDVDAEFEAEFAKEEAEENEDGGGGE